MGSLDSSGIFVTSLHPKRFVLLFDFGNPLDYNIQNFQLFDVVGGCWGFCCMAGPCMTTRSMNLVYSNEKLSSEIISCWIVFLGAKTANGKVKGKKVLNCEADQLGINSKHEIY